MVYFVTLPSYDCNTTTATLNIRHGETIYFPPLASRNLRMRSI
jgi:hypothetical protein